MLPSVQSMIRDEDILLLPTERWAIKELLTFEHIRPGVFVGLARCSTFVVGQDEIRIYAHTPAHEDVLGIREKGRGEDQYWTC